MESSTIPSFEVWVMYIYIGHNETSPTRLSPINEQDQKDVTKQQRKKDSNTYHISHFAFVSSGNRGRGRVPEV